MPPRRTPRGNSDQLMMSQTGDSAFTDIITEENYVNNGAWIEDNDCYYYRYNPKMKSYFCPHERNILRRNLYSKRELDSFFARLKAGDKTKQPECLGIYTIALGLFFLALGVLFIVLAWRSGYTNNVLREKWGLLQWFMWISMATFFVFGFVFIGLGLFLFFDKVSYHQQRKRRMEPMIKDENIRVGNRGLNWQYTTHSLILHCNYFGPNDNRMGKVGVNKKLFNQPKSAMKRSARGGASGGPRGGRGGARGGGRRNRPAVQRGRQASPINLKSPKGGRKRYNNSRAMVSGASRSVSRGRSPPESMRRTPGRSSRYKNSRRQ